MPWNKVCAVVAALLWVPPLTAQKVDTVVLRNGDRITGELKNLDRGSIMYKTDDMGTLAIEWDHVSRLTSPRYFEVEVTTGRRYYGSLRAPGDTAQLVVATEQFTDTLPLEAVVRIFPLAAKFVGRIDGYIDVGLTFQHANDVRQLSLAAEAVYRGQKWRHELDLSSYFQDQADVDGSSRNSASFQAQRLYRSRWTGLASTSLEQNEELELEARASLAGGVGRYMLQNNYTVVSTGGGLTYTREKFTGSAATSNVELLLTGEFSFVRRDSPTTDLNVTLTAYPSITTFGRIRLQFDTRAAHELVKDFTISLTFFDTYDSQPPSTTATSNDFGGTVSLGWKF